MVEQPHKTQRKSYKNENRYLLPHPLVIQAREEGPDDRFLKILDGNVIVQLVDADGQELPPSKQGVLTSPDGSLLQLLDQTLTANFSLKVSELHVITRIGC